MPRENILCLNFFDDRLHRLQQSDPGLTIDACFSLYPEKKGTETVYCFLDEIQTLRGWEPFVDRLMRSERCEALDHRLFVADVVARNRHPDARAGTVLGNVSVLVS